jgi:hypothetical protein
MTNTGYHLTDGTRRAFHEGDRHKEADMGSEIMIRRSTEADRTDIVRLAELDSRHAPRGDVMLAFVDDELRAAVDVDSGDTVADPFHPTAELIELLRMSVGQPDRASGFRLRSFGHAAEAA